MKTETSYPDPLLTLPTPNNDTLYMSAVVSLDEPYILNFPDTQERCYVVNVFNMWQELEHYIGSRATGTGAGSFDLMPPGWQGTVPQGVKGLQVTICDRPGFCLESKALFYFFNK